MFNWYNPKAKKNTIIGYLSRKYTKEQLTNLPDNSVLALPDTFESDHYAEELNTIFTNSPWKTVKYTPASTKSLSGVFSTVKQRLFGKKQEVGEENVSDTSSGNSDNSETDQNLPKDTDDDHLPGSFSWEQNETENKLKEKAIEYTPLPPPLHEDKDYQKLIQARKEAIDALNHRLKVEEEGKKQKFRRRCEEWKRLKEQGKDTKVAEKHLSSEEVENLESEWQWENRPMPTLPGSFPEETDSLTSADGEEVTNQSPLSTSVYHDANEETDGETNSLANQETPLLTYQFRLNEAGIIVLWKELGQKLQEEPYQNCFFEVNKTYRNCWVTAQVTQPLPTELPAGVNCLFELVKTAEELRQKNDWDYCLVTEFQPAEESETSESEDSESETATPLPKGTYRYEFATDAKGLISAWRTPSVSWKDADVYQEKYFALDVAKYANSYLKVKTLDSLPRNLPTTRYLFSPCANENDFYSREPNWINCLVWEQEPLSKLKQCLDCHTYLTPLNLTNYCESCPVKTHQTPLKSFWENNRNSLIIAGIIVLAIIIYQAQ